METVSVLISDECNGAQHPWSPMEKFGVETCQLPWSPIDGAAWMLNILMEYQKKSVWMASLMECHVEFVVYLHTRDDVEGSGSVENLRSTNETDSLM